LKCIKSEIHPWASSVFCTGCSGFSSTAIAAFESEAATEASVWIYHDSDAHDYPR
jgi:hypothetical protein